MRPIDSFVKRFLLFLSNRLLPEERRLEFRDSLRVVKKMDYRPHDVRLYVDTRYENEWRVHSCALEPETIEWIETFVKPGDIFFDVGSNVGAYSLVAAKHTGRSAKIYAFEPAFATFAQLTRNIFLNDCSDCITPLQVALFEETKIDYFYYSNAAAGFSLHSFASSVDFNGAEFTPAQQQFVIGYRMDDFITTLMTGVPNHIKIDVDGKELEILRGSKGTLADPQLRSLMLEINESLSTTSEVLGLLEEAGLKLYSKHSQTGASPCGRFSGMFNCVFTRD